MERELASSLAESVLPGTGRVVVSSVDLTPSVRTQTRPEVETPKEGNAMADSVPYKSRARKTG